MKNEISTLHHHSMLGFRGIGIEREMEKQPHILIARHTLYYNDYIYVIFFFWTFLLILFLFCLRLYGEVLLLQYFTWTNGLI
jgi:hypothetical protein